MRFIRARKSLQTLICLSVLAAGISGCLTADKTVSAVYEGEHDLFRFLVVYQNLATQSDKSAADLAWLRALYANRDHLIVSPVGSPSPWETLGEGAYLRISNSLYAGLDLSAPAATGLARESTPIPLDDIQILPGRFFVRGSRSLCYFQQIIIPGRTADALLDDFSRRLASSTSSGSFVAGIDAELQRRQTGTPQMSWDDFTRAVIEQTSWMMQHESTDAAGQPTSLIDDPLDMRTLQSLRVALVSGRLKLVRTGDKIHFSAAMTEADVTGLTAFAEAFRKAVSGIAGNGATAIPTEKARENIAERDMLNGVTLIAADKTHVQVTVDLTMLFNAFYSPLDTGIQPKGDNALNMLNVAGDSLDVDRDLTVEKIVADFKAGALQPYPPKKSVDPGNGMGTIHPLAQRAGK